MLNEEWKPIPGFDEYEISNQGRVKRKSKTVSLTRIDKRFDRDKVFNRTYKETILKPRVEPDSGNRPVVRLFNNQGNEVRRKVHRLMGLVFFGVKEIEHINGDFFDNRLENLRTYDYQSLRYKQV